MCQKVLEWYEEGLKCYRFQEEEEYEEDNIANAATLWIDDLFDVWIYTYEQTTNLHANPPTTSAVCSNVVVL